MKVLHVINNLAPEGAQTLLVNLSNEFAKKGLEHKIFILGKSNSFLHNQLEKNNIKIIGGKRESLFNPLIIFDLKNEMENFDIVHAHLFPSIYWVILAGFLTSKGKIPTIITEHSTSNNRRNRFIFKISDALFYRVYKRIISISEETKDSLIKWLKFTAKKTITIYNGINISKYKNARSLGLRSMLELNPSDRILLCVGSLREPKNHILMLRALSNLIEEYKLVIIGEGNLQNKLIEETKLLDISKRVFFLGVKPDVERYYKSCDLFVLPSKWEGFGLVAAEAMAAGIPVLVSNVPGLSQVVGDAGFHFESENENDLANQINYIFDHPLEAARRVELAKQRVEMFSIETMAEKYLNVYNSLSNENTSNI